VGTTARQRERENTHTNTKNPNTILDTACSLTSEKIHKHTQAQKDERGGSSHKKKEKYQM
jgi:hypothetical protein